MGIFATTNVLRKIICNLRLHNELTKTELSKLCGNGKSVPDGICFLIWLGKIEKVRGKSQKREITYYRLRKQKVTFQYEV